MNLPYVFSGVLSVTIQLAIVNGYGMHKADLTKPALHSALRWFFIAQTPYKVVVCLNKIAVLLLYKRIFISKPFQIACWTVLTVVVAWSIGAICATIFQCVPIEGAWDKTVDAKCIDTNAFWIAYAVCNILTDAVVLSLPIPVVFKLHLNMRERVMLCGVFMLGGLSVSPFAISSTCALLTDLQCRCLWNRSNNLRRELPPQQERHNVEFYPTRHLDAGRGERRHHLCLPACSEAAIKSRAVTYIWHDADRAG